MNNNTSLLIKDLDLNTICPDPAIIIMAKRGSGKTWICRSLLEHFRNYPAGVIISHTEKIDPFFQKFFPDTFIYDKYDPVIFKKILARQVEILKKAELKKQQGKKIDTRLFLLMDDCLSDSKEWSKDEALKEILFDGRHYHITYILTMQEPMAILPSLRTNFDYVFLLFSDDMNVQEKYFKQYTGMFPNFSSFKKVYDKLTEDYGAMVLKKRECGREIPDKVFHYKSKNVEPKMMGCKQLVKFHERNYDKNWLDKAMQNTFNINSYIKKRNTCNFDVKKIDSRGKAY